MPLGKDLADQTMMYPKPAICSRWSYMIGDRVVQCFNFIVLGPSRPHILSRLFHVPLTGLYSMWWVLTVYLGGHSRVLEIVPVESMLHGSVWRASHYCIGITRSRCMHRMMDNVIYVLGMSTEIFILNYIMIRSVHACI